jgi:hypothetical protein
LQMWILLKRIPHGYGSEYGIANILPDIFVDYLMSSKRIIG